MPPRSISCFTNYRAIISLSNVLKRNYACGLCAIWKSSQFGRVIIVISAQVLPPIERDWSPWHRVRAGERRHMLRSWLLIRILLQTAISHFLVLWQILFSDFVIIFHNNWMLQKSVQSIKIFTEGSSVNDAVKMKINASFITPFPTLFLANPIILVNFLLYWHFQDKQIV